MLLFEHLLLSLIIASIFAYITKRVGISLTFACANVMLDVIDKPLGYIFVGTGRFLLHSLVVVLLIGAILYIILRNGYPIAFTSGMIFHQICDQMWLWMPIWLYPMMYNPFRLHSGYDLITGLTMCCSWEMKTTEIIFAILSMIIIAILISATRSSKFKLRA